MSIGCIPHDWTQAIVTPVFKRGDAANVDNYRPISLTSVACKIMERVVSADMLHYLRQNNIISNHQHGFLSGRSTSTNLLETLNDWTLAIKNRQSIIVAYIDYSKAFDCVTREKLLIKLSAYGITGNLLKWIDSFLSNRTQRTRVGSSLSDIVYLTSGVVQGSVIGPLLFLLFINEISELLCCDRCTCKLYADDVKLYTAVFLNEDTALLQNKLDVLFEWSSAWQLNISTSKCATMQINTLPGCPDLCLNNIALSNVKEFKDLGVVIDNNLKFTSHVNYVVAKASARACLIHKCFVSKDVHTLTRAYKAYVRPLLEYASCVWSPVYTTSIKLIESVQRKFTKRLQGYSHLNYTSRLTNLGMESLELRRLHSDLIFTYKILLGLTKINPADFFTFPSSAHNTRGHAHKLVLNDSRVNVRQHFFADRVIKPWNSLKVGPSSFNSISSFKSCLKDNDFSKFLKHK
jgi:hypothetical protein